MVHCFAAEEFAESGASPSRRARPSDSGDRARRVCEGDSGGVHERVLFGNEVQMVTSAKMVRVPGLASTLLKAATCVAPHPAQRPGAKDKCILNSGGILWVLAAEKFFRQC
jgi:hypothetical protein